MLRLVPAHLKCAWAARDGFLLRESGSVCRIPGNFLNEGLYSVTAIIGKGTIDVQLMEDYVVSFHVHDTGEMRKELFHHWIGTVRPRLAWSTEQIDGR